MNIEITKKIVDSICWRHEGKMAGINSISTSCLENPICQARQKTETVCKNCYAKKYLNMRPTLKEKCSRNREFYTKTKINLEDVPPILSSVFRFESFGEIENVLQVKNYFTIANKNRHCTFALWTKNAQIVQDAIRHNDEKPNNMIVIYSEPRVNKNYTPKEIQNIKKYYPCIDKIFRVTDGRQKLTCDSNCAKCLKCYTKTEELEIITEKLKK